jgi:hypothetical protein
VNSPEARVYKHWILVPPHDPAVPPSFIGRSADIETVSEGIVQRAEVASIGRSGLPGTLKQQNALWRDYRNYLRQALSNFEGALRLPNRSACLLLYYAALNFSKAELLDTHHALLVNRRIGHGLSFNPTRARSVKGDHLSVIDGVFPLLYERRTGRSWPKGQVLSIPRLLAQVPEIQSQARALGVGTRVSGLFQLIAFDATSSWIVLAVQEADSSLTRSTQTSKLLNSHFEAIPQPGNWRDHFAISRRMPGTTFRFYQSKATVPRLNSDTMDTKALQITWALKDILSHRTEDIYDSWVTPYLYDTRPLALPASLARYALLFYASSLVRYKPSMFDAQAYPEQGLLFDAIARECALPLLIETLVGLERRAQFFYAADSYRL